MTDKYLSRPEEIVLLAIWKLEGNAYGVSIRNLVQKMTGKYWSVGAVYVPLQRLEKKGLLKSRNSRPVPERGGRRKRLFAITPAGRKEMDELFRVQAVLWQGYNRAQSEKNS
jgi:DNA-binding PadR family transcriptional regulator